MIKKGDVTYVGCIGWINANWTGANPIPFLNKIVFFVLKL